MAMIGPLVHFLSTSFHKLKEKVWNNAIIKVGRQLKKLNITGEDWMVTRRIKSQVPSFKITCINKSLKKKKR